MTPTIQGSVIEERPSRPLRTMRISLPALLVGALALVLGACGGDGARDLGPTPGPGTQPPAVNLFVNPGIEDGEEPWISLETPAWGAPFSASGAQAHSGESSALLELRSSEPGSVAARVYGVVQEISADEFPEQLSGYYYVESWEKGTPKQYLQFVVIVFDATTIPPGLGVTNYQIRYPLAGIDEPPFEIGNAKFAFVGMDEPELGRWVYFERNIRQDFEELWGAAPEGFSRLRILFEVRWDGRTAEDAPSSADVYFDDLYLGPAREGGG